MSIGSYGEKLAANHLLYKGYRILKKNYRTKFGEIDLIAQNRQTLVFCEVKTRISNSFGGPLEAVNYYKQKKLKKLADFYLAAYEIDDLDVRFDVIAVEIDKTNKNIKIDHVEDAFY